MYTYMHACTSIPLIYTLYCLCDMLCQCLMHVICCSILLCAPQAIKSKASFRLWILFVLIVFSFSLLFLDWYNWTRFDHLTLLLGINVILDMKCCMFLQWRDMHGWSIWCSKYHRHCLWHVGIVYCTYMCAAAMCCVYIMSWLSINFMHFLFQCKH